MLKLKKIRLLIPESIINEDHYNEWTARQWQHVLEDIYEDGDAKPEDSVTGDFPYTWHMIQDVGGKFAVIHVHIYERNLHG